MYYKVNYKLSLLLTQKIKIMNTNFVKRVAKLSGMTQNEIAEMSHNEIVHKVILPKILHEGGQDIRGWRISDDYMLLIADFGEYLWKQNWSSGEALLEIAMQRLSNGAVLHEPTRYDMLIERYDKYSAKWDQPGLMTDGCWKFLTKQAKTCLKSPNIREHMVKIICGLAEHLDKYGEPRRHYMLSSSCLKMVTPQEMFQWAWQMIYWDKNIDPNDLYCYFATPQRWQLYPVLFKERWNKIDKKDFYRRIGIKGFFHKLKARKTVLTAAA